MRVLLDDRPIEIDPQTVARAIEVARDTAIAEGRIVIEVLGDGRSVDPAIIDNPPDDSAGFTELKMVTADPGVFVSVTLSDAAGLLEEAADAQQKAADEVLAGRDAEAMEPLQRAFRAWGVIHDVVDKSASLLSLDLGTIKTEHGSGAEIIEGLADQLGEIKRALTDHDTSALSDVLAYEMPEQVERWRGLLSAMGRAADGEG
ncbi:MAG TPA: hypothetical protein ENK11_10540 [Phycisphaerales bacterium]|nr:hypothetical protein [Phycisphaerales bacterium]